MTCIIIRICNNARVLVHVITMEMSTPLFAENVFTRKRLTTRQTLGRSFPPVPRSLSNRTCLDLSSSRQKYNSRARIYTKNRDCVPRNAKRCNEAARGCSRIADSYVGMHYAFSLCAVARSIRTQRAPPTENVTWCGDQSREKTEIASPLLRATLPYIINALARLMLVYTHRRIHLSCQLGEPSIFAYFYCEPDFTLYIERYCNYTLYMQDITIEIWLRNE